MFIKEITGYKYLTEIEAINAVKSVNDYYTLPDQAGDVTKEWVNYNYSYNFNYWYIYYNETLNIILGDPTIFEI
jgi:hypothetical protein